MKSAQAENFQELSKAFERITKDFEQIKERDTGSKLTVFIDRFNQLSFEAEKMLKIANNGNQPSEQQNALIGEMIILRDFCLKRLK